MPSKKSKREKRKLNFITETISVFENMNTEQAENQIKKLQAEAKGLKQQYYRRMA